MREGTRGVPREARRRVSPDGDGRWPIRLASLALRDFRNIERLDLAVPDEGLVVVGENGQGKTNFLEAAYYLQLLRSVRGARDVDVVRFGAAGFYLEGAGARRPDDCRGVRARVAAQAGDAWTAPPPAD